MVIFTVSYTKSVCSLKATIWLVYLRITIIMSLHLYPNTKLYEPRSWTQCDEMHHICLSLQGSLSKRFLSFRVQLYCNKLSIIKVKQNNIFVLITSCGLKRQHGITGKVAFFFHFWVLYFSRSTMKN